MRIKICGIRSAADAEAAIAAGADALGFNGWPGSRRYLDLATARDWIAGLPPAICRVAVLVDPGEERVREVVALGCFHALQLHGEETPEFCAWARGFGLAIIKAFRLGGGVSLPVIDAYSGVDILLDGPAGASMGGAGSVCDWGGARRLVEAYPGRRFWLAGGLRAGNVAEAIRGVRPHAVDVASGVECGPGSKDPGLVCEFVRVARRVAG